MDQASSGWRFGSGCAGRLAERVFSVHMPNGSGNGWAKIDAFDALAATLDERPAGDLIVAGDFTGHSVSKTAGWFRSPTRTASSPRCLAASRHAHAVPEHPRRKWQEAVAGVDGEKVSVFGGFPREMGPTNARHRGQAIKMFAAV